MNFSIKPRGLIYFENGCPLARKLLITLDAAMIVNAKWTTGTKIYNAYLT